MRKRKAKVTVYGRITLDQSDMNKGTVQKVFRFIGMKGNSGSLKKRKTHKPYYFYKTERSEDTVDDVFK